MRAWDLQEGYDDMPRGETVDGPTLDKDECVKVVELMPVLDLLERLFGTSGNPIAVQGIPTELGREIELLLRQHGRLGG